MACRVVRERCVLLLGKNGAGKSTIANLLLEHDSLSPDEPPFRVSNEVLASVTREVKRNTPEFMRGNILYKLTVLDTVGIFEAAVESNIIVDYLNSRCIRVIDLILFVHRKGRFTAEDREVFSFIMAKFRVSSISALVVTGCENDDTTKREELVRELKVNPSTREIASQMGMGIYPVGFPPLRRLPPVFQQAYIPQMVKDRDMLLDLILQGRERGEQHCF